MPGFQNLESFTRGPSSALPSNTRHHDAQQQGRDHVFMDYHLRIGQITADTNVPAGQSLREQRLDETEIGAGTTVTLLDAKREPEWVKQASANAVAKSLGFDLNAADCVAWDVFDAVLAPGDVIAMITWRDQATAEAFERHAALPEDTRMRRVRIVRDYGMFDRREAPQYYPDVQRNA